MSASASSSAQSHSSQSYMDHISEIVQTSITDAETSLSSSSSNNNTSSSVVKSSSVLRPKSFFVAWNSVPTLVFDGFPLFIEQMKNRLNKTNDKLLLKQENFGSKWPKITLGYPLGMGLQTIEELIKFKHICESMENELSISSSSSSSMGRKTNATIPIQTISVVHYKQRSLEDIYECRDYNIENRTNHNNKEEAGATEPSQSPLPVVPPSKEEQDRVNLVLNEWNSLDEYLERIKSIPLQPYRDPSANGYSCVIFLKLQHRQQRQQSKDDDTIASSDRNGLLPIMNIIRQFRKKIDIEFPNRFEWILDDSLHCTIRALDPLLSPWE